MQDDSGYYWCPHCDRGPLASPTCPRCGADLSKEGAAETDRGASPPMESEPSEDDGEPRSGDGE